MAQSSEKKLGLSDVDRWGGDIGGRDGHSINPSNNNTVVIPSPSPYGDPLIVPAGTGAEGVRGTRKEVCS